MPASPRSIVGSELAVAKTEIDEARLLVLLAAPEAVAAADAVALRENPNETLPEPVAAVTADPDRRKPRPT